LNAGTVTTGEQGIDSEKALVVERISSMPPPSGRARPQPVRPPQSASQFSYPRRRRSGMVAPTITPVSGSTACSALWRQNALAHP
jgi:hypothetical protein